MSEVRRSPELSPIEKTLLAVEEAALKFRQTYSADPACVNAAMRGRINDSDPKRNEYFGIIMGRLKKKPRAVIERRPQPEVQVVRPRENPLLNRPVPEKSLNPDESAALIAKAKEALRKAAWKQTLAEAAKNEKLHPEDAYQNDDAT